MTIINRPGTKILYSKFKFRAKQYLRSTGTSKVREAEEWERRFRTELEDAAKDEKPPPKKPSLTPTLAVLRDMDVGRALGEGRTKKYVDYGIGQHWKRLIAFFPDASHVTAEGLRDYVQARRSVQTRGQTIRKELVTLKRGLKLGLVAEHRVEVPLSWPSVAEEEPDAKQEGHLIPPDTLHLFLGELTGEPRDLMILALLTGLRDGELRRVDPKWLMHTPPDTAIPAVLRLPAYATKNRKKREVGLVQTALDIVKRTPFARRTKGKHKGEPIDHKTTFRKATKRCGAPQTIKLRDMRHTFATVAAERTGDEMGVALVMGHVSGVMTLRYQTANVERLGKIALAVWEWYQGSAP